MKYRSVGLVLLVLGLILGGQLFVLPKKVLHLGIHAGSSWGVPNSRENRVLDRVIQQFQKKYPDIEVVYESGIPKEDYSDWLADSILEGRQADLFMVPEDDLALLAQKGALSRLDDRLTPDMIQSFYPVSYQAGLFQGNSYALPFESNPVMMCVNKALLDKEGIALPSATWTLDDFYAICQKVTKDTDGDGVLDQYGVTDYGWKEALLAYGGRLFTNQGINVNSPEMRRSLAFISKLEALNQHYNVRSQDFDQGKVAFYPMTLAQYRTYKPYPYHVTKYSRFEWTCIQMPAENSSINATQVSTSLFALSSKTKYPHQAWELLTMLSADKKVQQELFEKSQGMSVLQSVMTSSTTQNILKRDDFGETSLTAKTLNQLMEGAENNQEMRKDSKKLAKLDYLLHQALQDNQVDSALPSIQKEIDSD